jgi:uncharacterized protein (UPF0335 family)
MKNKESFIEKASQLWDKLNKLEEESTDLYEFEKEFDHSINNFGHQALEEVIGSKKKDRREKKNSKPAIPK